MKKEVVVIKNTIYMFLRMFFVMFLTLYSTRLLIQVLGFEGYGVYDLIFGVVLLFNVFSSSIAASLQRFFNVSNDNNAEQSNIYSVSLQIFFIIGLIVLVLGYSLASNFVGHLNIPVNHNHEAIIFFQLCILNLVFMVFRLPFIALLVSNEKMGIYALLSIFDAILKFFGVLILNYISLNQSNLIVYGVLLSLITCTITMVYIFVCYAKIKMPRLRLRVKRQTYKELLSFSGWTLFGTSGALFSQQGLSLIFNKFFGVLVNAANAVAQQSYTAIYQFVNSFQTAYSPYLMKTYAQKNYIELEKLIIFFSKLSVFLYLLVALPLFAFTEYILKLWLGEIPDYTVIFVRLSLIVVFFEVLSTPLWLTIQATGNIKNYQIIISLIFLLNLPIAYLFFLIWKQPILAFAAKIFTAVLAYIYRVFNVGSLGYLKVDVYIRGVIVKWSVLLVGLSPIIYFYISKEDGVFLNIFIKTFVLLFVFLVMTFFLLLSSYEKKLIFNFIYRIFKRVKV